MNQQPLFNEIFSQGAGKRSVKVECISVGPARSSDPETSKLAADANKSERDIQRIRVHEFMKSVGEYGATDYEISQACKILRTSAGKRRLELQQAGLVIKTEMRRLTDTQSSACVWRVK